MDLVERRHGGVFGEFADVMRADEGCRMGGYGGDEDEDHASRFAMGGDPMQCDDGLIPDVIQKDTVPEDDDAKWVDAADDEPERGDNTDIAHVHIPKPPENVDWNHLIKQYQCNQPWLPSETYKMLPENKKDSEMCAGESARAIANFEAIVLPLGLTKLAMVSLAIPENVSRDNLARWSPVIEERLEWCGIRVCDTPVIKDPALNGFIRVFHVNWKFYVCVVLDRGVSIDSLGLEYNVAAECYNCRMLGYHYLAVDRSTAIINKCY